MRVATMCPTMSLVIFRLACRAALVLALLGVVVGCGPTHAPATIASDHALRPG